MDAAPALVLFISLAFLYGTLQLLVLSSGSRTLGWRIMPVALTAGLSASAIAVFLVQLGWTHLFSTLTGQLLPSVAGTAGYTIDPFIEEVGKVAPLLLVLLLARVRRQLGAADVVIVAAALGAGFGLAENLLRFSHVAGATAWAPAEGLWYVPQGLLGTLVIVGPIAMLTAWLPEGATVAPLLTPSSQLVGIDVHLVWSSLVGLSLALALRAPGRWRLLSPLPFLVAGFDHVGVNALLAAVAIPGVLVTLFKLLGSFDGWYPLVAIAIATLLDRPILARGLANEPALRLRAERGAGGRISLAVGLLSRPRALLRLWRFVLRRRAFALTSATAPGDPALPEARARLAELRQAIDEDRPLPATAPGSLALGPRTIIPLVLAVPVLFYFVLADFAPTAGLQNLLAAPIVFPALVLLLAGGMAWRAMSLVGVARALPLVVRLGSAPVVLVTVLGALATLGGLAGGGLSIVRAVGGAGPLQPVLPGDHMLAAITACVLVTAVGLALLLLLASSPPALSFLGLAAASEDTALLEALAARGLLGALMTAAAAAAAAAAHAAAGAMGAGGGDGVPPTQPSPTDPTYDPNPTTEPPSPGPPTQPAPEPDMPGPFPPEPPTLPSPTDPMPPGPPSEPGLPSEPPTGPPAEPPPTEPSPGPTSEPPPPSEPPRTDPMPPTQPSPGVEPPPPPEPVEPPPPTLRSPGT